MLKLFVAAKLPDNGENVPDSGSNERLEFACVDEMVPPGLYNVTGWPVGTTARANQRGDASAPLVEKMVPAIAWNNSLAVATTELVAVPAVVVGFPPSASTLPPDVLVKLPVLPSAGCWGVPPGVRPNSSPIQLSLADPEFPKKTSGRNTELTVLAPTYKPFGDDMAMSIELIVEPVPPVLVFVTVKSTMSVACPPIVGPAVRLELMTKSAFTTDPLKASPAAAASKPSCLIPILLKARN